MSLKIFLLIIAHEVCATIEQIFFKKSANRIPRQSMRGIRPYILYLKEILGFPAVWLGFLMTALAWIIWFAVLAGAQLSVAVPADSMQYIMIILASRIFLKERMHWTRITGTILILIGIIFLAKS